MFGLIQSCVIVSIRRRGLPSQNTRDQNLEIIPYSSFNQRRMLTNKSVSETVYHNQAYIFMFSEYGVLKWILNKNNL